MRQATLGAKPHLKTIPIKNADTVVIPNGTPVAFIFNGTDDGLAVVLPATAGAAKATSLLAGIAEMPGSVSIPVGGIGQAVVEGICLSVKITQSTRATSTDSFNSFPAIAVGDVLVVDTVGNALSRFGSQGQEDELQFAMAGQSLASGASSASNTSNTNLLVQNTIKMFLRIM